MKVFEKTKMSIKSRGIPSESNSKSHVSRNWLLLLCLASFSAGMFFSNRTWLVPGTKHIMTDIKNEGKRLVTQPCNQIIKLVTRANESSIIENSSPFLQKTEHRKRYLMVIGINTAFSSQKRRDSLRQTWVPNAEDRKKLEEKRGIIVRFVIGHSSTRNGFLDKTIEEEEKKHGDFLRLDHVEGYHELSAKTKIYFSTAAAMWDADFYVKVDDDVHVNIGTLSNILLSHHNKPRVYIGCMKSGPVHYEKTRKYHEPEFWKFGDEGNNYFRHATGQIYAISNDLAHYISNNQPVLHKFANEDVSLGAWFIGLEVQHVDERRLCCGSRQECQFKATMDTPCAASFDWKCSGICKSAERIAGVHERCGEGKNVLWSKDY